MTKQEKYQKIWNSGIVPESKREKRKKKNQKRIFDLLQQK
jgi:hypothetical protein